MSVDRPPPIATVPRAAYLHVPFCLHRCGYCDFTVLAGRDDLSTAYLDAIERELAALEHPREVDTLFIGGGTPTHLTAPELDRLCGTLARWLPLAEGGEWSVEANPHDLPNEKLDGLAAAGVNRISLGVQSFDPAVLETLERSHSPEQAADAAARCRERFASVSVDLIFGVPRQTVESWTRTLDAAIATDVPHVSAYGLTFEKGTAFWTRRLRGTLAEPCEEAARAMQSEAMRRLPSAGLVQYEISNFARPGHRCRHNETYWRAEPFLGFGPGAASLIDGVRRLNHRSATTYLRRVLAGESPEMETEPLDRETLARELIMLRLRTVEGLSLARFERVANQSLDAFAPGVADAMADRDWLIRSDDFVRLSDEGRFVADEVIAAFF